MTKKSRANLLKLAALLELNVIEKPARPIFGRPTPTLAGRYRGRDVRVFYYSTGSGKNRTQWVAISTKVNNPSGFSLKVSSENFLTRAGRTFGVGDVEIGDPAFDKRFYIKSDDADFTRAALIPEIRNKMTEAWSGGGRGAITIERNEAKYAEVGSFARKHIVERFQEMVEIVCDFGEIADAHG